MKVTEFDSQAAKLTEIGLIEIYFDTGGELRLGITETGRNFFNRLDLESSK